MAPNTNDEVLKQLLKLAHTTRVRVVIQVGGQMIVGTLLTPQAYRSKLGAGEEAAEPTLEDNDYLHLGDADIAGTNGPWLYRCRLSDVRSYGVTP